MPKRHVGARSPKRRRSSPSSPRSSLLVVALVAALFAVPPAGVVANAAPAGPPPRSKRPVRPAPEAVEPAAASVSEDRARLAERLRSAVAGSGFEASTVGVWVGIKTDARLETVFAQNAKQSFVPASLSKLFTGAAALKLLGPSRKFVTRVAASVEPKGSVLPGPLYLIGGGDPSFVSENMWALVNDFLRSGVTQVAGDVVVDDSLFDDERFAEDRQSVRVDRAYDAPVGAMSMNWNSVNVYVRPGAAPGDEAKVFADPATPYLRVRNRATTGARGAGKSIAVERSSEPGFAGDAITVTGKIGAGSDEAVVYKSVTKPDLWSGHHLVEFLKQRGVTVKGAVRAGRAPADAKTFAYVESKPLVQIVADMAKWSNNYVAEMLVKNVAADGGEKPATMKGGLKEVNRYLVELGFSADSFEFVNPSGLTRENKFTPEQVGRFLEAVRMDFSLFPEYLASLPVAGVDGTLRSRMKAGPATGWVRAKTGLLTGAVGLAGYSGRPNGTVATFAFLYNGSGREDKARALFDRLASILAED